MFGTDEQISLIEATDTSSIRLIFEATQETILQSALKESGVM